MDLHRIEAEIKKDLFEIEADLKFWLK